MAKPTDDRIPFTLRLPPALHQRLLAAAGSGTSLNAEILTRLAQSFDTIPEQLAELKSWLEDHERRIDKVEYKVADARRFTGQDYDD